MMADPQAARSSGDKAGRHARPRSFRRWRKRRIKHIGMAMFRRTNAYLGRRSLIPDRPVLEADLFSWAKDFEANWRTIRAELDAVMQRRSTLPRFQDLVPGQSRISPDDKWHAFALYGYGFRSERNCQACPATAALLETVPGLQSAFFSILAPGKQIPSHCGVSKGLIRAHLGLLVPRRANDCTMKVGDVTCSWQEGRILFFDDTYPHEVHNDTDEERVVLLFDFERPMTAGGRRLNRALYWLLRRSPYYHQALRNQESWEQRYWGDEVPPRAAAGDPARP